MTSFTAAPSSAIATPGGAPQTFTATGTYTGGVTGVIPRGQGSWSPAPALPFLSVNLAAIGLGGKVYAMGGQTSSILDDSITNQVAAFDPLTFAWALRAPM